MEVKGVKRAVTFGLIFILLLSLVMTAGPSSVKASLKADVWLKYPIPQKGEPGGWLLTSDFATEGTGITAVAVGAHGVIYVALEETAGSPLNGYSLFKSTDNDQTWTALWKIPSWDKPAGGPPSDPDSKIISLVLPRRDHPQILYLATQYYVYKSTDGGENFVTTGNRPGYGSGTDPTSSRLITSLDVTYYRGHHLALVGSRDADPSANNYGGVYLLNESQPFNSWGDLGVGNGVASQVYDVLDVAFATNSLKNQQIVALVTDDVPATFTTKVTSKFSSSNWNSVISDATLGAFTSFGGSLAFPSDYNILDTSEDKNLHYAGIDAGPASAIYMIIGNQTPNVSTALPMTIPDATNAVYTMDIVGDSENTTLVAGLTSGNIFTWSLISGLVGTPSTPPSVTSTTQNAYVSIGELDLPGYSVYVGTSGANSGLARSVDSGDTFAQIAFISDDLTTITDLAVSPNYDYDGTIYMITMGNSNRSILWRTTDFGQTWEVVLTEGQTIRHGNSFTTVAPFNKVKISPYFAFDTTIFIAESVGAPRIWRSTDNGFHFAPLLSKTGTAGTITSWAIAGQKIVLAGDNTGNFYKTDNAGTTWSTAIASGLANFSSMVLSPDYENDSTILASDSSGRIRLSRDNGETWQTLSTTPTGLGAGTVVAFSPFYVRDNTVYAADTATDTGILRFIIGSSTGWQRIDRINPNRVEEVTKAGKTNISGLKIVGDGNGLSALYATGSDPVVKRVIGVTAAEGGLARSLNPEADLTPNAEAPLFEIVNTKLPVGTTLFGLWSAQGSPTIIWSIDTAVTPDTLYTYTDTLSAPIELTLPANGASSGKQTSARVLWEGTGSATSYNLWYDTDPNLNSPPVQVYSTAAETNITPPGGLLSGTTYHWKVRAGQPGNSIFTPGATITYGAPAIGRFSETWSFTTGMGAAAWNPFVPIGNVNPSPGARGVDPIQTIFQWNPSDDTVSYEFQLSDNSAFAGSDTKKVKVPAYGWPGDLEFGKTYYWRVRSVKANGATSEWATGIFTTAEEPLAATPSSPPPPPPMPTPPIPESEIPLHLWVIIGIGSLLLIAVLILIARVRIYR